MTTHWRANVAMAAWLVLFVCAMLTVQVPYAAPFSFIVVAFVTWDYGIRVARAWIALVHVLMPVTMFWLEVGPYFVFGDNRGLVTLFMAGTLVTAGILAYLTDWVHSLTIDLDHSRSALLRANTQLQAALGEVKELKGLLPICAWCNHIRDDGGAWEKLETYVVRHSHATFTHGMCPKCLAQNTHTMAPASYLISSTTPASAPRM